MKNLPLTNIKEFDVYKTKHYITYERIINNFYIEQFIHSYDKTSIHCCWIFASPTSIFMTTKEGISITTNNYE